MKNTILALLTTIVMISCVPAKKYSEVYDENEENKTEAQNYKAQALDSESKLKNAQLSLNQYQSDSKILVRDTSRLATELRNLLVQYDYAKSQLDKLEKEYALLYENTTVQTSGMNASIDAQRRELQRKEDSLLNLANALEVKEAQLKDREQRVLELEELLKKQQEAIQALKDKVMQALLGFRDKGLTVEEKDGKIYVSMEAKLLFSSGSTTVNSEGKQALIQLAQVLEDQKDIEIIVEGHTDDDAMRSSKHPTNNWELSVLRATSVVSIMLDNSEMAPVQITASGRSEFHPIDPNDKSKNRRIEIIISPNLDALFEIIK